jgi:hypothetical protein
MGFVIGIDLDNTIAVYDDLIHRVGTELGLVRQALSANKMEVRDFIRDLPDGETKWRELQGIIYGPRMREALLSDGVRHFLEMCDKRKIKTYVISHKSAFSQYDSTHTNLRKVALEWMAKNSLFSSAAMGLKPQDVYFEWSQQEKIRRIKDVGCTHFIDDLREVFLEDSFPSEVEKLLYDPRNKAEPIEGVRVFSNWKEIADYLFGQ